MVVDVKKESLLRPTDCFIKKKKQGYHSSVEFGLGGHGAIGNQQGVRNKQKEKPCIV